MENLTMEFELVKTGFLRTQGSKDSVIKIYDFIYNIESFTTKSFEQNYVLAQCYCLIGQTGYSTSIIEKELNNVSGKERNNLLTLLNEIKFKNFIVTYKDPRDLIVNLNNKYKLQPDDFIVEKNDLGGYNLKLKDNVQFLILFHKNYRVKDLKNRKLNIGYSYHNIDNHILQKIIIHLDWLSYLKEDFLKFYRENKFEGRMPDVNEKWFNLLEIYDFRLSIKNSDKIYSHFTIYDKLQNNYGFHLEIFNQEIVEIEYDPNY